MQQTFLLPTSTQYPFDSVCSHIVNALHDRNFAVTGVEVLFETYSNAQAIYRMVKSITIPEINFDLQFHRQQGYIDHNRYNCAAVSDLSIPRKVLTVYEDYSGPTLYVYVGKHWQQDKANFVHGLHVHSKMNNELRTYLKYSGSVEPKRGSFYQHRLNPYLVFDDDLGREYSPIGSEPTYYHTLEVMGEFETYLREIVVPFISNAPDATEREAQTAPIGSPWKGYATDQNRERIGAQMREMLTGHTYTFDDGWSSSGKRTQTFQGISTTSYSSAGHVTVSDSYGSWGFDTDGKTLVEFKQNSLTIDHYALAGNALHWEITVTD